MFKKVIARSIDCKNCFALFYSFKYLAHVYYPTYEFVYGCGCSSNILFDVLIAVMFNNHEKINNSFFIVPTGF